MREATPRDARKPGAPGTRAAPLPEARPMDARANPPTSQLIQKHGNLETVLASLDRDKYKVGDGAPVGMAAFCVDFQGGMVTSGDGTQVRFTLSSPDSPVPLPSPGSRAFPIQGGPGAVHAARGAEARKHSPTQVDRARPGWVTSGGLCTMDAGAGPCRAQSFILSSPPSPPPPAPQQQQSRRRPTRPPCPPQMASSSSWSRKSLSMRSA